MLGLSGQATLIIMYFEGFSHVFIKWFGVYSLLKSKLLKYIPTLKLASETLRLKGSVFV